VLFRSGEAPRFHADSYRRLRQSLAWPGHAVHPCLITWPTYPGSLWSLFLLLPANQDPLQPLAQPPEGLHVYNHALHRASFALPNDLR
jgi:spermidine synthase